MQARGRLLPVGTFSDLTDLTRRPPPPERNRKASMCLSKLPNHDGGGCRDEVVLLRPCRPLAPFYDRCLHVGHVPWFLHFQPLLCLQHT
jgi:hypothetical protein